MFKVESRGGIDWYIFKRYVKCIETGTNDSTVTKGRKKLAIEDYKKFTGVLKELGWKSELTAGEQQKALTNDDEVCSSVMRQMKEALVPMEGMTKEAFKLLNGILEDDKLNKDTVMQREIKNLRSALQALKNRRTSTTSASTSVRWMGLTSRTRWA